MSIQLPSRIIGKSCGPNPGFVRQLWLMESKQVQHLPDPLYLVGNDSLLVPSRMISFFSEASFYKMKFRNKECVFSESLVRGEAGPKLSQVIQFAIPQANFETDAWLVNNIHNRWVIFFEDHLRKVRILGSPGVPAELSFGSVINADKSSTFSLTCEATHPAYYTDSLPALERVFSGAFGESFG